MLGAVAAIAKFSRGREWTLKYPSETMRRFCGKINNRFWEKATTCLTFTESVESSPRS